MDWFARFTEETARHWIVDRRLAAKRLAFVERMYKDLRRLSLAPSKKEEIGALYVAHRLGEKHYTVNYTPRKRSPADVWAIKERDGDWRIMLVQVRSAFAPDQPERLTREEREEATLFASFVWECFKASSKVPPEAKDGIRFISIGFAGVLLKVNNGGVQPELETAFYIDSVHSQAIDAEWSDSKERAVALVHQAL